MQSMNEAKGEGSRNVDEVGRRQCWCDGYATSLKKRIILYVCVALLITTLAAGSVRYIIYYGNSADGADDSATKSTVELDVVVNIESESHEVYAPIPNHTFTEIAGAEVGAKVMLNIVASGGNMSKPTAISNELKIVYKRMEGARRLSDGLRDLNASIETQLVVFQPVEEDSTNSDAHGNPWTQNAVITVFGKNITSVSCVQSVKGGMLSNCEYYDSQEHLAERRLQFVTAGVIFIVPYTVGEVIGKPVYSRKKTKKFLSAIHPKNVVGCFPGSALVFTPKGKKTMRALEVGDLVLTHDGYSPIYLFGHYDPFARTEMVQIQTAVGQSLSLTPDHYVPFVNGTYASARNVQKGDAVWVKGTVDKMIKTVVTKTGSVLEIGLFNPYPYGGTIVVNGILASAHSSWLLESVMPETYIPPVYEVLLTPVRLLHRLFPSWLQRFADRVAGKGSLDQKGVVGIAHAAVMTILT